MTGDSLALVLVAVLTFVGLFVTPAMALWTQIYLRRHLGKTNGNGNVTEMVTRIETKVDLESTAAYGHRVEDRFLFGVVFDKLGVPMPVLPIQTQPPVGKEVEDHHDSAHQLVQPDGSGEIRSNGREGPSRS